MLTIELPYDTVIFVKSTYLREKKTNSKNLCLNIHSNITTEKNPKYISTNEWIKPKGSTNYTIVY